MTDKDKTREMTEEKKYQEWLNKANRLFPKVGNLYRVRATTAEFRHENSSKRFQLVRGNIVMLTWTESPEAFAGKMQWLEQRRRQEGRTDMPSQIFQFQLLYGERELKSTCWVGDWEKVFQKIDL